MEPELDNDPATKRVAFGERWHSEACTGGWPDGSDEHFQIAGGRESGGAPPQSGGG